MRSEDNSFFLLKDLLVDEDERKERCCRELVLVTISITSKMTTWKNN